MFVGTVSEFRFRLTLPVSAMVSNVPIRIIQTIVFLIADRNPRNAIYVVTRNQISKTSFGPGFVVIRRLIRTITAIIVSVAIPHCRNASVIVRTSETVARAGSLRARRIVLVGVVTAIVITLLHPCWPWISCEEYRIRLHPASRIYHRTDPAR